MLLRWVISWLKSWDRDGSRISEDIILTGQRHNFLGKVVYDRFPAGEPSLQRLSVV